MPDVSPNSSFLKRNWRVCVSAVLVVLLVLLPFFVNWHKTGVYLTDDKATTTSTTTTTRQMPPAAPSPPSAQVPGAKTASPSPMPAPTVTREETTKTETAFRQPIWVTLAQPFLGATAGLIALWQFIDKRKQDKEHFDRKEQEDRFKDIQDRFANTDPKTRANAALRLAEMARVPKPGAGGKPICEENYPFFLRAAAPLAIALHMEENDSVRAANKKALANIVASVKGKEENDPLLRALIKDLYEANLTAKREFIKALAAFCPETESGAEPDFKRLTAAAPFVVSSSFIDGEAATEATLRSLMASDEFKTDRALHVPVGNESGKLSASPLTAVQQDAARLIDTRDALAVALCALSRPTNLPKADACYKEWYLYSQNFGIGLELAFLVGAHLDNAILSGAKLDGANLNGAKLYRTRLYGVELYGANVANVGSPNAADFSDSNWRGAYFTDSHGKANQKPWKWFIQKYGTPTEKADLVAQEAAAKAANAPANNPPAGGNTTP